MACLKMPRSVNKHLPSQAAKNLGGGHQLPVGHRYACRFGAVWQHFCGPQTGDGGCPCEWPASACPINQIKGCVSQQGAQQRPSSAPAVGKLWVVCHVCTAVQGKIVACHQNSILRAHLEGRRGA